MYLWAALPASAATMGIVRGMARLGISEVLSFFVLMPLLVSLWFYLAGWGVDKYRLKRQQMAHAAE